MSIQTQTHSLSIQTHSLSLGSLVRRPETGSFLGLAAVFVFFTIFGGSNFASATGPRVGSMLRLRSASSRFRLVC
jgi:hypothetical protein